MRFVLTIFILLFSIPNLKALEPERFSNANFTLNEESPNFFEYNGEVYVVGDEGTHGVELMKIDTLGNKLELVIDINEDGDSNPFILTKLGDKFIFTTRNDNKLPTKFWSSDGTKASTTLLFEVEESSGNESLYTGMIIRDNKLYLNLPGDQGFGTELWVTDGTVENSKKVNEDIEEVKILSMVKVNDRIIFLGDNGATEDNYALWALDNDDEPTKLRNINLKRGRASGFNSWFRKTDELLFFTTFNEENEESTDLWATDGTKDGIVNLATFDSEHDIDLSFSTRNLSMNDKLFLVTYDQEYNISGLWVSDGTTEGTFDLKEIGINTDNIYEVNFNGSIKDKLIFSIIDNVNYNTTLWSTDGYANGTYNLSDISTDGLFNSWNRNQMKGYLYYTSEHSEVYSVWRTNGIPGSATKIIDIPKNQNSDSYYPKMYEYNNNNKIHLSSFLGENYDLYSMNVETEEIELIRSSQDGGVDDMVFHDRVTYMLYSGSDKNTMHYNFVGNTEEIDINDKTNSEPYNDLELQLSADYIYFYADYEGDESYQLYRFENPASGISSVEDFESNQVNFYPNPANNNLTLELDEMTDISIVDINGNQVLSFSDFTGGVIDVSKLAVGFYSITNNNGKLLGKFIKAE